MSDLEKRDEIITLKEGKWKFDTYYDHKRKTLFYNPSMALETSNGGKQTPAMGFLHEAAHAIQDLESPDQFTEDTNSKDDTYGDKEEKRVITEIETPAAKKAGEGTREDHGGTIYETSGPTSTEKVSDQTNDEE